MDNEKRQSYEDNKKRVLFLGAPIFQIPIVQKAKGMGLYVGIVDINKNAPAFPYADKVFVCSIRDVEAVLKIAKEFKPDGIIIGACDTSVVTGACICKELNLPGHTVKAAINSTDKVKMLEAFEKNDVSHPCFQVVKKNDIDTFVINMPYPVITKPIDSAGGRGVSIVHNNNELKEAVKFSSEAGLTGDIIIEEYMSGPEVSVEVLVIDGIPYVLQITDKITSGEPNFFEIGHAQPSSLPIDVKESVKKLASKAVLAVGLVNSPAHVEIIITDHGPKMVELGARLGGDCITTYLLDNSLSGISMSRAAIELALGIKPGVSNFSDSGACVGVRFIPAKEGILKEIHGLDKVSNMDNVIKIEIMGEIGKYYLKATDDSARFGYVVCKGKTTNDALYQCQRIINMLEFIVE